MGGLEFVVLFISVIFFVFCYVKRKYRYWEDFGVPFIEPTFPKGNVGTAGKTEHLFELIKKFYNCLKGKGMPIGGMYLTIKPAAIALDLDFVKTVLVKDFNYFHDRGFYVNERDDPLTAHLVAIEGDRWRDLRTKLTPAFSSGKIKLMFPIVMNISEKFISRVNCDLANNTDLELGDYLSRFTVDVIGSCAFGLDCNGIDNSNTEFHIMGKKVFNRSGSELRRLFVVNFQRLARFLRFRMISKDISEFYTRIVTETVALREKENIKRNDFLNLLIQLKNKGQLDDDSGKNDGKITLNEVVANAFLFLVAGFETSSTTMQFCLLELANAIEIQDRLREEIKTVLERYDNKITYEALSEMKYLDQVINETLRKHPVAGILSRSIKNDYKVPNTEVILEKGNQIFIPVLAIHHDPDIYPDPDKFDPERFTPEAVKSRHPYAFLAFGEGPRNCIGMRFGMMQTKIGISCLLMNYKFSPCAKTKYPIEYDKTISLLSPDGGCWLRMEAC
ncbi:cytochrome P450 6a2-like [Phlebotomus argentipes]|uniref:cytochrome P450 6a2-like n=1 Tax=Phlebotomus argentipes TaxID=94469 RepID=UPI0028931E42|nr:cytochrome P450 6a2-like [Phlebotomus argentipes]